MVSKKAFLQGIEDILQTLPPAKTFSENGFNAYYKHLQHRFNDDAHFLATVEAIIFTQREFPKISDFIMNMPVVYMTPEQIDRARRADEQMRLKIEKMNQEAGVYDVTA